MLTEANLDSVFIHHIESVSLEVIDVDIDTFLLNLPGPTRIRIPGADGSRNRVLITLLHGNEPSGIKAIQQLLREEILPAVDIYCYLIAIEAARIPPRFSHRQVPGKRDFNRCFHAPFDIDDQGLVCESLLAEIQDLKPEAVVDMHNTSGEGPSFGITTSYDEKHDEIVSIFTDRLIVTDLRLGAIMESNSSDIPVVTIECGGAFESVADRLAVEGLRRYFTKRQLFVSEARDYDIELYFNPMRIEMHEAITLQYSDQAVAGADITLKTDIEHHNFGLVTEQTLLGWVGEGAMEKLGAFDAIRSNHFRQLYREQDGALYPRQNQKLFMITSNSDIAKSDCLWYVTLES